MITGVCLNPCVDRMIVIDELNYGNINRIISKKDSPAGKGFNVARALSRLGIASAATGFLFEENAKFFLDAIVGDGVENHILILEGAARTNIKVFESKKSVVTELNESGNSVSSRELKLIEANIKELAGRSEYMVFSGSVPPGMDAKTYKKLIEIVNETDCRAVLDADGELLAQGIKAKPFLIKPNHYEIEQLVGHKLCNVQEIKAAAKEIVADGISIVAVSLGEAGALITDGISTFYSEGLKVEVKSTVGAGDCLMAGILLGLSHKKSLDEALKLGSASAGSSIIHEGTNLTDIESINTIYNMVKIAEI